jgi:hypothetical protein
MYVVFVGKEENVVKTPLSLRTFYGSHHDLVVTYIGLNRTGL